MRIEDEVFAGYAVSPEALTACGFVREGDELVCTGELPGEDMDVRIVYDGAFHGRITDRETGEEYTVFRREGATGYSAGVRNLFVGMLTDIRDKCARNLYYHSAQAQRICGWMIDTFGEGPEFLWDKLPAFSAFRRPDSRKWYAVMGRIPRSKVLPESGDDRPVEVINVKIDPSRLPELLDRPGYRPAYHMNKRSWVTILLDGTLPDGEITGHIRRSRESV